MKRVELKQISKKAGSMTELPGEFMWSAPLAKQIRMIRNALGMTQKQLAQKVRAEQHGIAQMEAKDNRDFHVSTLKRIAEGLNCELVVRLVPKENIEGLLERKSRERAQKLISISTANAALESQAPNADLIKDQIEEMKNTILDKHRSTLWNEK